MIWHLLLADSDKYEVPFMTVSPFTGVRPLISWNRKSNDFIAGQWNSGQLVPASVTATTWAGNVQASHPAQLKMGGMWPTCTHAHTEPEHADVLSEVPTVMQEE